MEKQHPFILVVDDDLEDCKILCQAIQDSSKVGTKVINKADTLIEQLRDEMKSHPPALIILDYNMPMVTGEELLVTLKTHKDLSQIPVIIYSTYMTTKLRKSLIGLGAMDCYFKPDNYKMLLQQASIFRNYAIYHSEKNEKTA